ncbi:olfactomedin-like protein 2A isoform X1 [Synchiropus splendidus]|uniref:olfactomedin-like protein 2A isoform X1 n=1 Tax=Synchiropus splendidus TaxID=270530 RepID=UPI00237ED035|nr:olfactomedin-like protein 2A isoform X1 [Synchiropus splendidus]
MWSFFFLLSCSVGGLDGMTGPTPSDRVLTPTPQASVRNDLSSREPERPTAKPLEDEQNRESVRQLLGDYDKVRTVSSGSDCVCRCTVRPIRIPRGSQETSDQTCVQEESYTLTIETSGSDCRRCECTAPLSAVLRSKQLMKGSHVRAVTNGKSAEGKAKEKDKKSLQKKKKTNNSKLEDDEGQRNVQTTNKQERQQTTTNKTKAVKVESKETIKDRSSKVIRGWTFYMAEGAHLPVEKERQKSVDQSVDVQLSDGHTVTIHPIVSPAVQTKPTATSTAATEDSKPTAQSHVQQTTKQLPQVTPVKHPTTPLTTVLSSPMTTRHAGARSRLGWSESLDQQPKPTTTPAMCKDTVASISEPVLHNSYGLSDGIWMKDARGHGNVIYLTNGHYGNELLEFRDMTTFKLGQVSNSYKLPYSYTGTSHVVFNGALYYNRAFSRDVIRYDLRQRYVSAWTTLHDAILEEQSLRSRTDVEFAVDESGIWLVYPALDTEGFHQEVILLNHVRPRDLQTIRSFRTGLRRGYYANIFLVCGVLYGVDAMNRHHANVTYAFDTHTLTHTVPNLAFVNTHSHTTQLTYCPLDKKLYAWDNGHQMTYDIVFAY